MAYHIEHVNAEIDFYENHDGTWRAAKFPSIGGQKNSVRDDYQTRAEMLRDLHARPHSFWEK